MFDDTSPLIDWPHKPRPAPIYAINWEHDQQPIWDHGGHVPGTRRPASRQAREARAVLEALIQKVPATFDDALAEAIRECGLGVWR